VCLTFLAALTAAAATAAGAAAPAQGLPEYQPVPGAYAVPVPERAGLRGREDLEAFLDGIMHAHLRAQRVAGAVVAVVKDGQLYFAKGYGYADVENRLPVDPAKTLFRPGSTTKLFTWTAVMQLVEQGRLDLDADVNQYLTQFQIPATFPQPITLRNLLTHTPGLEDGGIGYLIAKSPDKLLPLEESLKVHMPARVRPPTTDFADGTNASYSNWGTALAGLIVANVSGMPFNDYVEQHILQPLQMHSSTLGEPLPPPLLENMSEGYKFKLGAYQPGHFEYIGPFGPAGSLSSTATDMANFMIAHLQDGRFGDARILQEETARLMHSRQLSPSPHVDGAGLGFYESWVNGRRLIGHGGDTIYFHTDLKLLKEESLGIFVSYNSGSVLPFSGRGDLIQEFMNRYYPAELPPLTPPEDFKERAALYAGTYRFNRHSFTKNERMFSLLSKLSVAPTPDNTLVVAFSGYPVATQYVEVAPHTFRRIDGHETIAFAMGEDGTATHLLGWPLAFIPAYKVPWHESLPLHGFIAGFGLLCFLVAVISALRNWKADRAGAAAARYARRLAGATGLVHLSFVILLVMTFAGGFEALFYAWPPVFRVALAMPLIAIPLTLGLVYFAVRAWKDRFWGLYGRIQYSVIAVMGLAFLWSLNFLNLVGYHFG
jgi:CubicO group peptidase (beta-lactamase class C family)